MNRRGVILMFALWVLAFLAVLAASAASGIRQKIIVLKKFNERSRMVHLLDAGVKFSAVRVRQTLDGSGFFYTPLTKTRIHNDPEFANILLGDDSVEIGYTAHDTGAPEAMSGVVDEERKININRVDTLTLQRLIERVTGLKSDGAGRLARAILDWRQYGESEIKGFWSADYYVNLQYPFRKKDADYETMDELLLVEGMTKELYERLADYITVYGEGKVNINTAPPAVLEALGLEDGLVAKILAVRRGKDGQDATLDDHVFTKVFDVASDVHAVIKLELREQRAIDALNLQGRLTVQSYYFSITARGRLARTDISRKVSAVAAARENRIIYWKEK